MDRCIHLNSLLICQQGHESSSDDSRKLSDAWEFQEDEIMHAKNKLRSTRAKLAVLEGKMAMAIMYEKVSFYFGNYIISLLLRSTLTSYLFLPVMHRRKWRRNRKGSMMLVERYGFSELH